MYTGSYFAREESSVVTVRYRKIVDHFLIKTLHADEDRGHVRPILF